MPDDGFEDVVWALVLSLAGWANLKERLALGKKKGPQRRQTKADLAVAEEVLLEAWQDAARCAAARVLTDVLKTRQEGNHDV